MKHNTTINSENQPGNFSSHPRGLSTLFFVEMWERFSYYGMRALLLLYMVESVERGGLGLSEKTGGAIYGLYTMMVYLLALPGGWLADHYFGLKKSVLYGGYIIVLGHACLALPFTESFFVGLLLIAIGTGLLKPNISSMVGELYPAHEQAKRDAGFSIFYMGINIGAFVSPFITGYMGEQVNWHYGFAMAGLGMVIGVVYYKFSENRLGDVGMPPAHASAKGESETDKEKNIRKWLWILSSVLVLFIVLMILKIVVIDPVLLAHASAYIIGFSSILYFSYIFLYENLTATEKNKVKVIFIFFLLSIAFYSGYEQQGSSLNLFAKRYTNMVVGSFEMPAGWLQSIPPIAVIIFSPLFAWLWIKLSHKKLNPSIPVKLSMGLIFAGLGYLVMMKASQIVAHQGKVLPTWLIVTYIIHTFGEICLYPVGLSAVSKIAPKKVLGQMMGLWFMSLALGNLFAGIFAGNFDEKRIGADTSYMAGLFLNVALAMFAAGIIGLILFKPVQSLLKKN
ncbi:MAG TPA: peptide MFS transporter [Cyclobacteriaceae bacterium]|nr:peptide MFS transporter [Cyclobacteriaceae bacterium]